MGCFAIEKFTQFTDKGCFAITIDRLMQFADIGCFAISKQKLLNTTVTSHIMC